MQYCIIFDISYNYTNSLARARRATVKIMANFYQATPDMLMGWFQQIDVDRGGTLSVAELQRALGMAGLNFSGKFTNSLINMVDADCSGALNVQEFLTMHGHLKAAWSAFMQADRDRSGILTLDEIVGAIGSLGFRLDLAPNGSFYTFIKSYDFDKSGRFSIDIFIAMYVTLFNAKQVHARMLTTNPSLSFDVYVWSLGQL